MKFRLLPASTNELLRLFWISLTKINHLSPRLLITLAALLFLTDIGYEGQRSPEKILLLLPLSIASIGIFFAFYLSLVYLAKGIGNPTRRGVVQFFIVIAAEITKSAFFIFFFRPENFVFHFLERLPGDITIAALYWLIAGVSHAARSDHQFAVSELKKAFEKLAKQRNLTLKTASEVEQELHDKASSALLADLDRLSGLSRQIMDSAKASEVKLEIQRLIRNQVRPLSRDLRSRVEVLQSIDPVTAPISKIRNLKTIPRFDSSYIASYAITIPNIFLTVLSKSDLQTSFLILVASFSYPLIGKMLQTFSTKRKVSIGFGLVISGFTALVSYLPMYFAVASFSLTWPALGLTSFSAGGILIFTCLMATGWFSLQRERAEIVEDIKRINQEAKHELDLLDQAIWVAQRRWSYLIHGTVQAALTVAASRLELARRPDEKLRENVESDINRAKQILSSPPELGASARSLLDEIAQTWQGVCSFEYQISPSAEQALDRSQTSTTCFIEIVKELVSNASRHGGASKFWLNAYLNAEADLELIAGNNGKPVPNDISAGLGFQMITDLTKDWQIDRKAAGFSATIPLPRLLTNSSL